MLIAGKKGKMIDFCIFLTCQLFKKFQNIETENIVSTIRISIRVGDIKRWEDKKDSSQI